MNIYIYLIQTEKLSFFIVTEICGLKFRMPFGILTQFPFGIGAALMPLIAYFVRFRVDMRSLKIEETCHIF